MVKQFFTKTRWLVTILLITLGIGQMWGATTTLAGWTFTSSSYPSNKTNFTATTGTMTTSSTFYLNGTGSTWNATKGYAFTAVTDITITLTLTQAVPAGTVFTLSAATFYNKASNAPMTGFSIKAKEGSGSFGTTGVGTTSWSLSTSSATKTTTYTTQAALASGTAIAFQLTGTGKAGAGQGYMNNITITATTYSVTYNGNSNTGGSVPTDDVKYITGTTVTVKANSGSLVRTNYTFGGWNTNTSGTGTNYTAGSGTFSITSDKTLYAKWEAVASCSNAPTVTAGSLKGSVSSSSSATAQCTSGVSNLGGAGCSMTSYGFAVGTSSNPTIGGTLTGTGKTYEVGSSIAVSTGFEKEITGLSASTTYYARPYATNGVGTGYGTQFSFTTLAACTAAPTVTAGSAGTITSTTAAVSCASGISSLGTGGCTITSYGFVYGTSANPTTANSTQQVGTTYTSTGVSFNTSLTGLTEGQLYYVRPYATNGYGTGYGTQTSFGTPKITPSGSSLAFGNKTVGTDDNTLTFTVSGIYLQSDISIGKSGTNAAMFSIDKTTVTQTDGTAASTTITVTYAPSAAGSHSATLTLTSTNAANKTVTLSGTGVYVDTFIDALQNTSGYTEASPHTESSTYSTPTLTDKSATTSGTCEQQHWHFMGWITKAKYDAGTTIADGDLQTPTTASNATYYAVWAKGSGSTTDNTITINTSVLTSYTTVNQSIGGITFKSTDNWGKITWSTYEYLQCKKNSELYNDDEFPGYIKSVTITRQPSGNYDGTVSGTVTLCVGSSKQPSSTCETAVSAYGGVTFNYTAVNNYTYLKFATSGTAAALSSISITYTVASYTYTDYKANCCANLITLAAPTITGSGCSITFDKSSPVETCSAAQDVTASVSVTNGYKVTALSFALSTGTYTIDTDPATVLPLTASQDFTLTFAQNHAAATLTTTATVVALQDKYYDYMHDNALKHTKSGNYGTAPTLDSKSVATEAGCMDNHYKFIGWVISTDVNDDGSLKGGYTLIPGGATGKYATGATYIAVWAEEE